MSQKKLLEVKNLQTEFPYDKKKTVAAIHNISFSMDEGEILGLVGESGCGKSVTALSIMGLVSHANGIVSQGEILFKGRDLLKMKREERRQIRGGDISMIFQEPMSSLNPAMKIEKQIMESIGLHSDMDKEQARKHTRKLLVDVGIPDPDRVMKNYPHQLSGGMSQRVMIALAMSCQPELLIADEPTTALDVTIQAQILELLREIQKKNNTSILLITHDLGVVAEMCSRVIVMYAGEIVESASCLKLFKEPLHPYTQGLIDSVPKLGSGRESLPWIPGSVPDLLSMPKACRFAPRCPYANDRCREDKPGLCEVTDQHYARCWYADALPAKADDAQASLPEHLRSARV
ncbi:MAG: ABC transporter ATP-binding protein [Clostridiales bacterium]|nr:ABC transporter ATP-binding protein [Clostridiales bacterium]MDD7431805.1 ABC transporter ATP-binding protein [Clostridiales bacterium]MDY3062374.1 ABC transporter ATP-binding protein [Eubacteriales bacterium]